jgi:hypothetical protein
MRKIFFSLVATLAFGSFAMANTVDVETVEAVESVELIEIEINLNAKALNLFNTTQFCPYCLGLINWPCLGASIQVLGTYLDSGMDPELAQSIAQGVYLGCVGQLPGR